MEDSTTPHGESTQPQARQLTRREALALEQKRARKVARPASRTRSSFNIGVMSVVALLTIATTVPADSMLSASAVQARQIALIAQQNAEAQLLAAGGGGLSVSGETYSGQTVYEYALASGMVTAPGFTNNPFGTIQWPFAVGVPVGSRFGATGGVRYEAHNGLDFNPGEGAPVQAIADGVVVLVKESNRGLGHVIGIEHQINGDTIVSIYAHLLAGSMRHQLGERVKVGDRVGNVGDTGFSTGPHLHFELRVGGLDGEQINPLPWLQENTN